MLNAHHGGLHLPEYFPPLLLLMKQRMSNISSSSTMALTTPMNQPCVAKLGCTSVTPSEGKEEGREKTRVSFFCNRGNSAKVQEEWEG